MRWLVTCVHSIINCLRQARTLHGIGRAQREIRYPPTCQRYPGTMDKRVADPAGRVSEFLARGAFQELSLPGGDLADATAGGGEASASAWQSCKYKSSIMEFRRRQRTYTAQRVGVAFILLLNAL